LALRKRNRASIFARVGRRRRSKALDANLVAIGSPMNRFDRRIGGAMEAQVEYLNGDFRVTRPGAFVRCAETGAPIPLDELRYWIVDEQAAFSSPEAVLKHLFVVK
jgi:hypothetical protein